MQYVRVNYVDAEPMKFGEFKEKFPKSGGANAEGDTKNAIEEAYDVIAVLLRIIDVLEHRQPLGKPKEGAE